MASTDVASVLAHYRQLLDSAQQEVTGDPAALRAAAQRLNATARDVGSARQRLAEAQGALAKAWDAGSRQGFDNIATMRGQQLATAGSTLDRQGNAAQGAAGVLSGAVEKFTALRARYEGNARALTASAASAASTGGGDDRTLAAEADRMGREYAEAADGIRRNVAAALNAITATLNPFPIQGGGHVNTMSLEQLNYIINHPGSYSVGTLAGAIAYKKLLEHEDAVAATGTGTIQGVNYPHPAPPGVERLDCTTFTLEVMKEALIKKEMITKEKWDELVREARDNDPNYPYRDPHRGPQLTGNQLMASLQRKFGWEALFWAPDPNNPNDGNRVVHTADYTDAKNRGTYWGVRVETDRQITDYRHTNPGAANDTVRLNQLDDLQFGLLTARRGDHMAVVVNGEVVEVHWAGSPNDPHTIQATPLRNWGWNSGAIAAPRDELDAAIPRPAAGR